MKSILSIVLPDELKSTIEFATTQHNGQFRRGTGLPYITHPIIVAKLITHYKGDSSNIVSLQAAALLHDVLEDTTATENCIRPFGDMTLSLVVELTSDDAEIAKVGKNEYLKLKMCSMTSYAFLLKLVDRLSNIIDGPREKYVADTIGLMTYLRDNRAGLTARQHRLINDIMTVCESF